MSYINEHYKVYEQDLYDLFKENSFDELLLYASENEGNILTEWNNGNPSSSEFFPKLLKYAKTSLDYFEAALISEKKYHAIFKMGGLSSLVNFINQANYNKMLLDEAEWSYTNEVKNIKHLDRILTLLDYNGSMNQSELCKQLNLSDSLLSQVLKKSAPLNLMISTKLGKYKYFRLTDYGRNVVKKIFSHPPQNGITYEEAVKQIANALHFEEVIDLENFSNYIRNYAVMKNATPIAPNDYITLQDTLNNQKEQHQIKAIFTSIDNNNTNHKYLFTKKIELDDTSITNGGAFYG